MKYLLPPAIAIFASTAGTALGCRSVGMPLGDVKVAAALAFALSTSAVFITMVLAGRSRPTRRHPSP